MTEDDRIDDLMREAASGYNPPPEVPREEMWARIQSARRQGGAVDEGVPRGAPTAPRVAPRRITPTFRPRWIPWAAAAAVLLAVGIWLGRLTMRSDTAAPIATTETRKVNPTAYRLATAEHLAQSEAFLTLFRASVTAGGNERLASATARQLLASNRLLLDSPAATDRKTRLLLEDLELVLAEIAQLSPQPREGDLELIRQGIDRENVMSRLRSAVPAGPTSTQGAL
jgi:hypothetical protein